MPIRDNRTLVDSADTVTGWDDLSGSAAGTQDTEVFREGSASVSEYAGTSRNGMLFDLGSAQDFSGNVFYMWFNTGVAGQLNDINAGGITMRFCGATVTDWFEIYLDGADTYSGGWKMYVVDIDVAREIATGGGSPTRGGTNGTTPATSAIRWVGITTQTATMTRMVDNMWIDAIWRLPAGEPGVIISGDNAGSPWTWDDVLFELDPNDPAKANGVIREDSGVLFINTPFQFGANGSPSDDHDFEDTNKVLAWESQNVLDNFYGFSVVGDGVNTQRFVAGVNGSAGQGWTVLAAPDGPRWFIDASDPEIEDAGFYGCSFTHTGTIDIDNALVDMYDTLLIDGEQLVHSTAVGSPEPGADFQRNTIVGAVPIVYPDSSDAAYLITVQPDKIIDCSFLYSSGHAIEILTGGTFDFIGNVFTGFPSSPESEREVHFNSDVTIDEVPLLENESNVAGITLTGTTRQIGGTFDSDGRAIDGVRVRLGRSAAAGFSPTQNLVMYLTSQTAPIGASSPDRFIPDNSVSPYREATSTNVIPIDTLVTGVPSPRSDFDVLFEFNSEILAAGRSAFMIAIEGDVTIDAGSVSMYEPTRSPLAGANRVNKIYANTPGSPSWSTAFTPPVFEVINFGDLVLNVSDGTTPEVHLEGNGSVTINNNVSVTITDIQPGTEIRVYPAQDFNSPVDLTEIAGEESTGSPSEFTFSASAGEIVDIVVLNIDYVLPPANRIRNFTVPASSTSFPISQIIDRNFSNP